VLTQNSDDLVILDNLEGSCDDKAEIVNTFSSVIQEIPRGGMTHCEVHGEGTETPVRGETEGRMLIEDFPIEVDADVGLHVLGTVV